MGDIMRAAADLAAGAAGAARSRHRGDNPQVKTLHRPSAFHDPSATVGREIAGHTGLTTGLGAIGEAFGPAASMIFGQAKTARTTSRPTSSQHSAGS